LPSALRASIIVSNEAERIDALTSYVEDIEREAHADFHKEYWAQDAMGAFSSLCRAW
jgi:hypothetical protein